MSQAHCTVLSQIAVHVNLSLVLRLFAPIIDKYGNETT